MRNITFYEIKDAVSNGIYEACHILNEFTLNHLNIAKSKEDNKLAIKIFDDLLENAELAKKESIPMCQDTGIVTCFVEIGYDLHIQCDLYEAINEGVRDAYNKYYLRKSVSDPITRINTNDNTPAIVHVKMVKGDKIKINIAPKGAGSENMSTMTMLNPTEGIDGIVNFVVNAVKKADGRPCPPLFLGIGIGGNFETCCLMAKNALLKTKPHEDEKIRNLEQRIKDEVNKLYIGPMGLGGKTTVLDCFINTYPCHIASLPVALNIQCHANRHVEVII